MAKAMIEESVEGFAKAVQRARDAGFRILEIHAAHGYLIHQFLSPLTNDREDEYGGSFENRTRFLLQTIDAARAVWPRDLPLFVRISSTDWVEGGWTLEDSIALCRVLKAKGDQADLVVLGRTLLADPVWPLRAAAQLKATTGKWPVQYERSNIF
jgi:2,4-dienoyl-CoA reductase-like NADH-dependent reductase (Old Yellow Enzyme family)